MFSLDHVTLRPLEPDDIDLLYRWDLDIELNILKGWTPRRSLHAFRQVYEQRIIQTSDTNIRFGIQYEDHLVGFVELGLIDHEQQRAAIGIAIGDKQVWGRGIGTTALRLILDYGFTVQGLERVYAEIYGFNARSLRLMQRAGFQQEGMLRQHELHNGKRQDLYIFGLLKPEFYQRHQSLFGLPHQEQVVQ